MNITENSMMSYKGQTGIQLSSTLTHSTDQVKLREACKDFESLFVKQMLDSMRKTVTKSGLIKENQGQMIFEDMLYDEYADKISDTANLGVADMMYQQLSRYEKGVDPSISLDLMV